MPPSNAPAADPSSRLVAAPTGQDAALAPLPAGAPLGSHYCPAVSRRDANTSLFSSPEHHLVELTRARLRSPETRGRRLLRLRPSGSDLEAA